MDEAAILPLNTALQSRDVESRDGWEWVSQARPGWLPVTHTSDMLTPRPQNVTDLNKNNDMLKVREVTMSMTVPKN